MCDGFSIQRSAKSDSKNEKSFKIQKKKLFFFSLQVKKCSNTMKMGMKTHTLQKAFVCNKHIKGNSFTRKCKTNRNYSVVSNGMKNN